MPIAVVVLTIATMYPYLRHRIPEIQAENLTLGIRTQERAACYG